MALTGADGLTLGGRPRDRGQQGVDEFVGVRLPFVDVQEPAQFQAGGTVHAGQGSPTLNR
jgi:hypothetical protein